MIYDKKFLVINCNGFKTTKYVSFLNIEDFSMTFAAFGP
jgi:hypothetical protein